MSPRSPGVEERALARRVASLEAELAELRPGGPQLGVSKRKKVRTSGGRVGQWWTPPWLAALLATWAGLDRPAPRGRRWRVLDAGAGMGALSLAALEHEHVDVTLAERDERLATKLERIIAPYGDRARLRRGDILAPARERELFDPEELRGFDVVISNPPWERDLPERFILRALEAAPRFCGIVPLNMLCGGERAGFWASVDLLRVKALPHRPKFDGDKGGMRDVMLIEVGPGGSLTRTRRTVLEVG